MGKIEITLLKGTVGNTEWWTEKDWKQHRRYVKQLKKDKQYLKPYTITFVCNPYPWFDDSKEIIPPEPYKVIWITLGKNN